MIHGTAIVDPAARIGQNVEIGPYCIIGPHVKLGDNVRLIAHVYIEAHTTIGADTVVYPYASLGTPPQHLKFDFKDSYLKIGQRNTIREYVTMNPGMLGEERLTKTGDDCYFMMAAHVGHDCIVGNNVILTNQATLGGHVTIGDFAILGGLSAVHQHVRVGPYAMIGGVSAVVSDVIPFGMVNGDRANLTGLNLVGLERRGFTREQITTLRSAYRIIFAREGTFAERVEQAANQFGVDEKVRQIIDFIRAKSSRGLCQPET